MLLEFKKSDFDFDCPDDLIAQYPLPNRTDSRLLHYDRGSGDIDHGQFSDLITYLRPGDLLVMNNSQVIPARLYGHKSTGGKVECLVERVHDDYHFEAHIKASKAPPVGSMLEIGDCGIQVLRRNGDLFYCKATTNINALLKSHGHIPLPPYIKRSDERLDHARYQTVYAKEDGSVAAPTAGLHFDEPLLRALIKQGINIDYVTLHVGAGTFQPLRVENISEHTMHAEYCEVTADLCNTIEETKARGGRVIAVGTTTLRSLETAAREGALKPYSGETSLFILPGYQFNVCDGLLTNFHLPGSTLLMLVSAFIGRENALALYQTAIEARYRFYSYGDASLLL